MTNPEKISLARSNSLSHVNRTRAVASTSPVGRQPVADSGSSLPKEAKESVQASGKNDHIKKAVNDLAGYVQNITRQLNFSVDEELGETVITVFDDMTGDVIRQIPSQDVLEMAKNLSEMKEKTSKGILFNGDA